MIDTKLVDLVKKFEYSKHCFDAEIGFKDYPSHFSIDRVVTDNKNMVAIAKTIIQILEEQLNNARLELIKL